MTRPARPHPAGRKRFFHYHDDENRFSRRRTFVTVIMVVLLGSHLILIPLQSAMTDTFIASTTLPLLSGTKRPIMIGSRSSSNKNDIHEFFVPSSIHPEDNKEVLRGVTVRSRGAQACRAPNAIVLLAQKKHSTYQRDSLGLLVQTLDLLRDNYLKAGKDHSSNTDIFLFHNGDFDDNDLVFLEDRLLLPIDGQEQQQQVGILRMVNLHNTVYWSLPESLKHDHQESWKGSDIYPIGYRHMCRWFGKAVWHFFQDWNHHYQENPGSNDVCQPYRYIARLDEDSFLLSPIHYDIFDHMAAHNYLYGYRMCAYEVEETLPKMWFKKWRKSLIASSDNSTNNQPQRQALLQISMSNNNSTTESQSPLLCGLYTNFFVADLEFFGTPEVIKFLREIDRRGLYYRKRFGDLLVHTLAVYAFAPAGQVHRFLDFTYQHATMDYFKDREKECISWGSIQAGYNDPEGEQKVDQFYQTHVLDKDCPTANLTYLYKDDLSPLHAHIPDAIRQQHEQQGGKFKLKTVYAGKVELPKQRVSVLTS